MLAALYGALGIWVMKTNFQVTQNNDVPYGLVILKRHGMVVWYGPIASPWEDVNCDSMELSRDDFDRLLGNLKTGEWRGTNRGG